MKSMLIGSTGFLGKSLQERFEFTHLVDSASVACEEDFDLVICAAPSAKKWFANKHPDQDTKQVEDLIKRLERLGPVQRFILLSTVDTYRNVVNATEGSPLCDSSNTYGFNRHKVETYVSDSFSSPLVLRLSGLVGKNLVKNPVFDMKYGNDISKLNGQSKMQFVPVSDVCDFISDSIHAQTSGVINLCGEPLRLQEIADLKNLELETSGPLVDYDVRSNYLQEKTGTPYLASSQSCLEEISNYFEGH